MPCIERSHSWEGSRHPWNRSFRCSKDFFYSLVRDKKMKWISKILGRKDDQSPSDPIIAKCTSFAQKFQITITDQEWKHVISNRDKIAKSPLGGAYVHKDVLHVLCFLCLFDGLFEAGVKLLDTGNTNEAENSLGKTRRLLPWPTVLFSLGLVYARSGKIKAATDIWNEVLESFELRSSLLSAIVPATLPDRDNFIAMTANRIDTTGHYTLGLTNLGELKDNIMSKLARTKLLMHMDFKCNCCGKTLSRPYSVDPVHSDIYTRPWYIDDQGLEHLVVVCLECGTIHDCSGSILKGLFTFGHNPVTIHDSINLIELVTINDSINPMELGIMIMEHCKHPEIESREVAIRKLGIPEDIIDILLKRNILGPAFARRPG